MASTTNPISDQIVTSSFISGLDIDMPQIRNQLYDPYSEDMWANTYLMLSDMGSIDSVKNEEYSHFEKLRSFEPFKVKNLSAPSAKTATYTIHADSLDANNKFFPRVGHTIMFAPTAGSAGLGHYAVITAIVDAGTATPDITVKALDNENLPATSDGETVIVVSSAQGEGTGLPVPATSKTAKFTNRLQRIKEKISATGDALTDELWFPIVGGDGSLQGWYNEAFKDGDYAMLQYIYNMFWFSTYDAATTDADGNIISTPSGMFETTGTYGTQVGYNSSSDITTFDTIAAYLLQENITVNTPIWVADGVEFHNHWENELRDEFAGANQSFLSKSTLDLGYTNDSFNATYGISSLKKSNYTYNFQPQVGWSSYASAGNFDFNERAIIAPMRKVADKMSGSMSNSVCMRYKAQGSLNRKFIMADLAGFGAALPNETVVSEVDTRSHGWLSQQGTEFFGANAFFEMYDTTT
jgi:hypothetical protein